MSDTVKGKCPRCGHDLEVVYSMFVQDDSVMADVEKIDDKEPEDVVCTNCGNELFIAISTSAHITAISEVDPKVYVDYEDEQKLKEADNGN